MHFLNSRTIQTNMVSGLLFFLLFFIFSALGVEMFGGLSCDKNYPCQGLGEHAHFRTFGMAFLTLFRIATGRVICTII